MKSSLVKILFFFAVRANELKQMEADQDREELMKVIEENQKTEQALREKLWAKNHQYQQDLEGQINHNRELRQQEYTRDNEEYVLGLQAEREYQYKLKDCLSNPTFDKLHPMRRAMEQKWEVVSYTE